MKTQSPDTHPKIEQMLIEGYRKMSAAEKFRHIEEMFRCAEILATADIKARHPDADERERRLRVASRRIPPELMKKAFNWDVAEKGY